MNKVFVAGGLVCSAFYSVAGSAAETVSKDLETVVVTGIVMSEASTLNVDPKRLRQPAPAHDGGEYLKQLPGFSLIRKGGSGGDPTFRGMAGSRLSIVNDDGMLLGGCSSRMDPPTAYITPQNYDRVIVVKGPQSVQYLPSAATVRFERDHTEALDPGLHGVAGVSLGSFGKQEMNLDAQYASTDYYARFRGSQGSADNYRDGDGNLINSHYDRQSFNTEVGYRGETNQLIMSVTQSMGEAAYADRGMDGVRFDRRQWQLRWMSELPLAMQNSLDVSIQQADIDHVMDNYSLRSFVPNAMRPEPAAMNPTRETTSARAVLSLEPSQGMAWRIGVDGSENQHANRMSMKQYSMPYESKPLLDDGRFEQRAAFVEMDWQVGERWWWFNGVRQDAWTVEDQRKMLMPSPMQMMPNPGVGEIREDDLNSGFSRVEYRASDLQVYLGYGRASRFPDYWELLGKARTTPMGTSSFYAESETLSQWDAGVMTQGDSWQVSLSAYTGRVDDFLLLSAEQPMQPEVVSNIEARLWGGELGGEWRPFEKLALRGSVSVSRGSNVTDQSYLPQVAPNEMRLSAEYQMQQWTLGGMWRGVAAQERFALNQGNIVALDKGPSAGFSTVSINASRKWQQLSLDIGVDNLFDKTYQEFLSTSGATIVGFDTLPRVPEPGRSVWANVRYTF